MPNAKCPNCGWIAPVEGVVVKCRRGNHRVKVPAPEEVVIFERDASGMIITDPKAEAELTALCERINTTA